MRGLAAQIQKKYSKTFSVNMDNKQWNMAIWTLVFIASFKDRINDARQEQFRCTDPAPVQGKFTLFFKVQLFTA